MKKALSILFLLTLVLSLAACSEKKVCRHQWGDALCTERPVCTLCGATANTVKGHTWQEATMDAPRTCAVCKITEGKPLSLEGTWKGVAQFFPIYFGVETENNCVIEAKMTLVLDDEGNMVQTLEYEEENYISCMTEIFMEMIYVSGEAGGISRVDTDAQYMEQYGMTVAEFSAQRARLNAPAEFTEKYTGSYTLEADRILYGADKEHRDRYYQYTLKEDDLVLRDKSTDMVYDLTKVS